MSTSATAPKTIKEKLAAAAAAFKTGEDLQTKLTALETEHGIATAEIARLTDALAVAEKLSGERATEITTHLATIKTITGERDTAQAEVAELPKKISDGVTEKLSEIGVKADQLPKTREGAPEEEGAHANEYKRLQATGDSLAAGNYFAKHREKILT